MPTNERNVQTFLLAMLATFATGAVLFLLQSVLLPFILALFLSFIFKPMVLFLRRHRIPGVVGLLLVFLFISGLFFGLGLIIASSMDSFVTALPRYQEKLTVLVQNISLASDALAKKYNLSSGQLQLSNVINLSAFTSIITSSFSSFISLMSNFVLVVLFLFFILAGSGDMIAKLRSVMVGDHPDKAVEILSNIDVKVRKYMITKSLINIATGFMTWVVLTILGVDFPLLWGFVAFLLNYIPNFGSIIAVSFPTLISLLQFGSITTPLLVLLLLMSGHTIIGNVIEPKVMQFSMNLSPLLVIVSLIFWGWLWGVWGMILAVPIMAIIKIILENIESLKPIAVLMSGSVPRG